MTLRQKQSKFAKMFAQLILWAFEQGYEVTIGEVLRTEQQAAYNAAHGLGIKNSIHTMKLAADLHLFIKGVYTTDKKDYEPLGKYWESLGGTWGGRFKSLYDPYHFSLEHNGVK